jgi:hypothetical protein
MSITSSPAMRCIRTRILLDVRTALAVLLACGFVVVTTADRLVCPDGCTDETPSQTLSQDAPSPCAFCHGWSGSPIVTASLPLPRVIARQPLIVACPTAPAPRTIEPPPKVA